MIGKKIRIGKENYKIEDRMVIEGKLSYLLSDSAGNFSFIPIDKQFFTKAKKSFNSLKE